MKMTASNFIFFHWIVWDWVDLFRGKIYVTQSYKTRNKSQDMFFE